jgi:hypothetical protein
MRARGSAIYIILIGLVHCFAVTDVLAQTIVAPSLQVCMPLNNGADLSSKGCACNINEDCIAVCAVPAKVCVGSPDIRACAPNGNGLDLSANGCSCGSNSDCEGVCVISTFTCAGGPGPATAPERCRAPGSGVGLSPDGCPCTTSSDCLTNCSVLTRTCGANIVGAIANTVTTISGVASADVFLGQAITDSATVAGGRAMPSRVQFVLHAPGDSACTTNLVTSTTAIAGNGSVTSPPYTPATVGTFRWTARYMGNAWNLPASTACSNILQQVVVTDTLFTHGFESP